MRWYIFILLFVCVVHVCSAGEGKDVQEGWIREFAIDLGKSVKLELVWLPAGEFTMGSNNCRVEEPPHKVQISKGFWIGKYEVTQEQYEAVLGKNPSRFKGAKNPVERVSWDAASEFMQRLNEQGLTNGVFRLPTEAEWEYACGPDCPVGWHDKGDGDRTHPVGETKPNANGLYDMLGNVSEWCQDWYEREYYIRSPEVDPQGPTSGVYRVLRGGSWDDDGGDCTPKVRNRAFPGNYDGTTGFRVLLSAPQPPKGN